jgi:hypothetical protein
MTPEQFEALVAYFAVEGDPFIRIIEILKMGFCILANAWGAKITPDRLDPWHEEPDSKNADPSMMGLG